MREQDNPFAAAEDSPSPEVAWADPNDLESLKADRFRRWLGATIDGLVPMVVAMPLGLVLGGMMGGDLGSDPEMMELLFYGAYFAGMLPFMFINWFLIVQRGQTLGKMAVGTRIVTEVGAPVDFVKGVILRNWVITALNSLCGFASLIDALMIFGEKRQCGHDLIAKTIVVEAKFWNPYTT